MSITWYYTSQHRGGFADGPPGMTRSPIRVDPDMMLDAGTESGWIRAARLRVRLGWRHTSSWPGLGGTGPGTDHESPRLAATISETPAML